LNVVNTDSFYPGSEYTGGLNELITQLANLLSQDIHQSYTFQKLGLHCHLLTMG